ncbi:MAG: hypothetical protein Q8N08_05745 [Methanobacteriaceae archaeon]|nr:hypothetical protein [Methanobacteriaceae archaeon]
MNTKTIKTRKQIDEKLIVVVKENLNHDTLIEDLNFFENISLSFEIGYMRELENILFSSLKNQNLIDLLKDLLNESDIFERYHFMTNKIYLNIIKELIDHVKVGEDEFLEDINSFRDEFYKGIDLDVDTLDVYPTLEIEVGLNLEDRELYPIEDPQLEYNNPIYINDMRLIYSDEAINPPSSIMLTLTL